MQDGHTHDHCCGHDHSQLDTLTHSHGQEIVLKTTIKASSKMIWSVITDNVKIKEWFNELHVNDLKEGGSLSFIINNEEISRYLITDVEDERYFSFTWGETGDVIISFDIQPASEEETQLKFTQWVPEVDAYTINDVATWYVCLEVIGQICEGRPAIDRPQHFKDAVVEIETLLLGK